METIRTFLRPVIDLQGTGWESGKNAPTIDNLLVLARLFQVDIGEIVVTRNIELSLPCTEHAAACMGETEAEYIPLRLIKSA